LPIRDYKQGGATMNIHKALLEHFIEVMENGKNKVNEGENS